MTTSKEILPGIRFCGWAELMSHHCFLLDSKTVHAWELLKPMSLRPTRLLWLHELSCPSLLQLISKESKFDYLPFGTAPCKLTVPNTGYPVGAQNRGALIFVGRHCIKKRYYGNESSAYKWKSTVDKEKGLCPCLEEEDGVSLENSKVVASKGQEGKETTRQPFLLLWALKAFFQDSLDLLP